MTNKELTDFTFVDRYEERKSANTFLKNEQTIKVLMVLGKSKVGKSYFIDQIVKENKSKSFLIFDFNDLSQECAYKSIIEQLDMYRNGGFLRFIKSNYSKAIKLAGETISDVLEITNNSNVSDIISNMINSNIYFLTNSNKQESSQKLICKYINDLSRYEDIIVVIKNFTKCDKYSLPTILQVIALTTEKDTNLKYVVSMDIDEYNNNEEIRDFFSNKIAMFPIKLRAFRDSKLFFEMLFDIFNFTDEDENSIEHTVK